MKKVNLTDSEYSSNSSDNGSQAAIKKILKKRIDVSKNKTLAKLTEMKRNQSKLEKSQMVSSYDVTLLADHLGKSVNLLSEKKEN